MRMPQARRRRAADRPGGNMEVLEVRQLMTADLDDQIREAARLGSATQYLQKNDSIANSTDVDMVSFTVTAGQRVSFDLDRPAGSTLDSVIRLFNSSGRQLAMNDNGAAPGEQRTQESYLEYTFSTGGRFYLGISGSRNAAYNPVSGTNDRVGSRGRYSLLVTEVDSDDQMTEAFGLGTISESTTRDGVIGNPVDVDMVQFIANAGQTISFDVDRPGGNLDSAIRLFDSNGNELAFNDNGAAPGEAVDRDSFLQYTFTSAGTYYLGVSGAGNAAYNPITGTGDSRGSNGAYQLVVSATSVSIDDSYEDNDSMTDAADLGIITGTLTLSDLQLRDSADWFRFTLGQSGTEESYVRMSLSHSAGDLDMILYGEDGQQISYSDSTTDLESVSLAGLAPGQYFLNVYGYYGAENSYSLSIVLPAPPADGFQNPQIAQLVAQAYVDQNLSRYEMIGILRSAGTDGIVDISELSDLRYLVSSGSPFAMPGYVRGLASDVVNYSPANLRSQGVAAGNLEAGSSASLLNTLIDEWFFGTDLPAVSSASYSYRASTGRLFNGTPSLSDMRQGYVGDCYFVAALGSLAERNPDAVQNLFVDNGDGTYTVRFYTRGGTADYVTVDRRLPASSDGTLVYSGLGLPVQSEATTLWIALAEKAYAQWNESGNSGRDGSNSYDAISGGWMGYVNQQVLGYVSSDTQITTNSQTALITALTTQQAVTIGTYPSATALVGGHAYVVSSYSATTQMFSLVNPWGSHQPGPLSWADLQRDCSWFTTTSPAGSGGFSASGVRSPNATGAVQQPALIVSAGRNVYPQVNDADLTTVPVAVERVREVETTVSSTAVKTSNRRVATNAVSMNGFNSEHHPGNSSELMTIDRLFADVATGLHTLI